MKAAGFNPGPVDDVFTGETAQSLVAYEKACGLPSKGWLIIVAEPTRQALMAEPAGRGNTQTLAQQPGQELQVVRASTLRDLDVKNPQGEEMGDIADLAIDLSNGRVAYAVVGYGGWLGLGEKQAAVLWQSLKADAAERQFTLNVATDQLKTLPSFAREEWPQTLDRQWLAQVHSRYGEKPYWETN